MTPSNFNIGDLAVIVANANSKIASESARYVGEIVTIMTSPAEIWQGSDWICFGHKVLHADGVKFVVSPQNLRKIPPDSGRLDHRMPQELETA